MCVGGMHLPKTGATIYHAQLGLSDKDGAFKGAIFGPAKRPGPTRFYKPSPMQSYKSYVQIPSNAWLKSSCKNVCNQIR